jgi:hypothetical protein
MFLWNISSKIDENQQFNEKMKNWYVSTALDIWEKVMQIDLVINSTSCDLLSYTSKENKEF